VHTGFLALSLRRGRGSTCPVSRWSGAPAAQSVVLRPPSMRQAWGRSGYPVAKKSYEKVRQACRPAFLPFCEARRRSCGRRNPVVLACRPCLPALIPEAEWHSAIGPGNLFECACGIKSQMNLAFERSTREKQHRRGAPVNVGIDPGLPPKKPFGSGTWRAPVFQKPVMGFPCQFSGVHGNVPGGSQDTSPAVQADHPDQEHTKDDAAPPILSGPRLL